MASEFLKRMAAQEQQNTGNSKLSNGSVSSVGAAGSRPDAVPQPSAFLLQMVKEEQKRNAAAEQAKQAELERQLDSAALQKQKELVNYKTSEEYKKTAPRIQTSGTGDFAADAGAYIGSILSNLFQTGDWKGDTKAGQLRAEGDYLQGVANDVKDQNVVLMDMQKFEQWPEEDRKDLLRYLDYTGRGTATGALPALLSGATAAKDRLDKKYGRETVRNIIESYSRKLNAEDAEETRKAGQENASLLESLLTVPVGIAGSAVATSDYLGSILKDVTGVSSGRFSGIDPNTPGAMPGIYTEAVRQKETENVKDWAQAAAEIQGANGQTQKAIGAVASTVYTAGIGALDNVTRVAMTGGIGSLALAATGSFSSAVREATLNGASAGQAAAIGLVKAASEVLTEKLPLDNLLGNLAKAGSGSGFISILKEATKQAGIELTTEELNLVAGIAAEALILQESSDYRKKIAEMVARGMSYEEAARAANADLVAQAGQTALQSGLSGFMTSAGTSVATQAGGTNRFTDVAQEYGTQKETAQATAQKLADLLKGNGKPQATQQGGQMGQADMDALIDETVAQLSGAPADPVNAAVESFESTGAVSNKQATDILNSVKAVQSLVQETGVKLDGLTMAQRRNAVKTAVEQIAQQKTAAEEEQKTTASEDTVVKEYISLEDYINKESPVWRNVDYTDDTTKATITQETHSQMVDSGSVVTVSDSVMKDVGQSFPDLRGMKKKERTPVLKDAINKLKTNIRQFLSGLSNQNFEFEVNGKVLDAKLYSTGINEVLEKVTQEKANMLYSTQDIFRNARYLYSTPDYDGDPNVYRWNYFYTPVQIGEDTVGVRIAVRDVKRGTSDKLPESQIYNWGIKKDTSLDGGSHGPKVASSDVSSDASNNIIRKDSETVNTENGAVGAAERGFSEKYALIDEYGAIPEGENPVRADQLPKSTDGKDRVSYTPRTAMEAKVTPDEFVPLIENATVRGGFSFMPITNSETVEKAKAEITKKGWKKAKEDWIADVRKGKASPQITAVGALLYNNAVNSGDFESAMDILSDYAQTVRNSAQALQAARILKTLTPENRLYMIEKTVKNLSEKIGWDITIDENLLAEYRALSDTSTDSALANELDGVINQGAKTAADSVLIGIESESLATRLGRRVSDRLTSEAKKKNITLEDLLFSDIMRFANDKANLDLQTQQERSSENLRALGDYFKYQYLFQDAWNIARSRVEDALWKMDQNDPRVNIIQNFLVNGGEFGGIENTDPLSALDIYNQRSTLRRGTKEAAEKAGILMKNKLNSQPKVKAKLRDILVENAKNKQSAADLIAQTAVKDLGLSGEEAAAISEDITRAFYQDLAEQSADRLASIFGKKEISQRQKLSIVENLERYYNMGAFSDPQYRARAFEKVFGEGTSLDIPSHLLERLTSAEDARRDDIVSEIQQNVADQLPSTLMEKFTALRYVNMLGNFRTQVKNVVGNLFMKGVRTVQNATAAALENIASKLSGGKLKRTRSATVSKEQKAAAAKDYANVKDLLIDGGKFKETDSADAFMKGVQEQRRIFKSAPLEGYRKLTNWAMETGDLIFAKDAYARALAGYLKANGITETDYSKIDTAILDEARLFAAKEAQEATFRDTNWLSGWISKAGRRKDTPAPIKAISEGIMPFRKTPANVLIRAEEYSPLGIVNSIVTSIRAMGKDSEITGAQVINSWAKSLTGTGLFGLGMLLQSLGALSTGPDEDEKKEGFEDLNGWQNYAITLPDGTNLTIDAFSPSAIPLLMGAELKKLIDENGFQLKDLEKALTSIAQPMIEMSMLQGVSDTLDNIQYAENNLGQLFINAAASYLTQGLTNTLLGQLERTFEGERMTTYVDKDSDIPDWLQRLIGKASAKIPGWDYQQIPYINAWGEEEENFEIGANAAYNLLSPSYIEKGVSNAVTQELNRLNEAQSDVNVYPARPDKTVTVNKQDYNLSAEEYVELAKLQGQTQKKLVEDILGSKNYGMLSDAEKAKAIRYAYEYARGKARGEIVPDHPGIETKWMAELEGNIAEGILRKVAAGTTEKFLGISIESAAYIADILDGLTAEPGKNTVRNVQELEAVVNAGKLSDKEQESALRDLMGDSLEKKFDAAQKMGIDADDFVAAYRKQLDTEGEGKKQKVLQYYIGTLGIDPAVAESLYKLYTGAK